MRTQNDHKVADCGSCAVKPQPNLPQPKTPTLLVNGDIAVKYFDCSAGLSLRLITCDISIKITPIKPSKASVVDGNYVKTEVL